MMSARASSACLGLFLTLCACDVGDSTFSAVKQGDGKACLAEDVQSNLQRILLPALQEESLPSGGLDPEAQRMNQAIRSAKILLTDVPVDQVKRDEESMVCEATVSFRIESARYEGQDRWPILYEIRPTLEAPGSFVVIGDFQSIRNQLRMLIQNLAAQ